MNEADVRLISGDQGGGKSCTATALVIDDCYEKITAIVSPEGLRYEASALVESEILRLENAGIPYDAHRHLRIFAPNSVESKVILKPKDYTIETSVRIFSNFHFYGVKFMLVDLETIIANINSTLIKDGWVVLDESFMVDKRDTMSNVGKMMAWFGAEARKRHLHMVIISQYFNMVQSRFAYFAKTRVLCEYDTYTKRISLDVNQKSEVMKSTSYYAPKYWPYYDHDEIIQKPQYKIDRTLAGMYSQ